MEKINISSISYCVLLGKTNSEGFIEVLDVIPALHSALVVPPIEILFIHLDVYCRERQLEIVGLYYANNVFMNNWFGFNVFCFDEQWMKIASDKLQNPIILQLENSKLSLNAVSPCLRAYCQESSQKWKEINYFVENSDETVSLASLAVQNKLHKNLADFENHLDE
uniref:MPN domain-containing protein n=1 Tax=Meloidogyne floridensis TaxID=298350 RepID=A0A915NY01_9BILA